MKLITRFLNKLSEKRRRNQASSGAGRRPRSVSLSLEALEERLVQSSGSTLSLASAITPASSFYSQTALIAPLSTPVVAVSMDLSPAQTAAAFTSITPIPAAQTVVPIGTDVATLDPAFLNVVAPYQLITAPVGPSTGGLGIQSHAPTTLAPLTFDQVEQGLTDIAAKAYQLRDLLGAPTGEPHAFGDHGLAQNFASRLIVWSPETSKNGAGAHMVSGLILGEWGRMGGSTWGFPTSDAYLLPGRTDALAQFYWDQSTFTGKMIIWTQPLGAHAIEGDIMQKYLSLGGGDYGIPVSSVFEMKGGAHYQDFLTKDGQTSSIVTNPKTDQTPGTGTHDVVGVIRDRWISLGTGYYFGFPTTDSTVHDSSGIRLNAVQHFRKFDGDGPHDSAIGVYSGKASYVTGEIYTCWYSSGGGLIFGIPTDDEQVANTETVTETRDNRGVVVDSMTTYNAFYTSYFISADGTNRGIEWTDAGSPHFRVDLGTGAFSPNWTPKSGPTGFEGTPILEPLLPSSKSKIGTTSAPLTVSPTYQILPGAIDRNVLDLITSIQSPNTLAAPIPLSADSIWLDPELWNGTPVTDYTPFAGFDALPADFDFDAINGIPIDPVAIDPVAIDPVAIARSAQTIAIDAIADGTYGEAPIVLNATADSGLAVSYQVLSGPATFTDNVLTFTGAGVVTVEATQAGDDSFEAATPVDVSFTVNKAHLAVAADNQTRVFGQANPAFTATITGFVNGETLANSGITGNADFSTKGTAASSVGTYAISAALGSLTADNYDFASFVAGSMKVTKAGTTIGLNSSVSSATVGQQVTFTATAAADSSSAVPAGTVTFKDGSILLGTGTLSNGVATFKTVNLALGSHAITVIYAGNGNFTSSTSSVLTQNVQQASKTTVQTSLASSTFGQALTLTATVTSAASAATLTGNVTFMDGNVILGTAALNSGTARLATSSLAVGSHSITAVYAGTATISGSTSTGVTQTVSKAAITTNTSVLSALVGQQLTLTATVAADSSSAVPVGTVTFKDGSTLLGTGTLSNGVATLKTANLALGSHAITVIYAGNGNFTSSTSSVLTQNVQQASKTVVQTSLASSTFGQALTLTATVTSAASAATLTGNVTFMDGNVILGTAALNNGTARLATSVLAVGSHSITAVYAGIATISGSTSAGVTQTVSKAVTTTSLTGPSASVLAGQPVGLTAKITPTAAGAAMPTGTVTFKDGTTVLGTGTIVNGVVIFSTSALKKGTHTITAAFAGDANFLTSSSLSLVVTIR